MSPEAHQAQRCGRIQPRNHIAVDPLEKGALRPLVGSDLDVWHSCDLKVTALPVWNQFANVIINGKMAQGHVRNQDTWRLCNLCKATSLWYLLQKLVNACQGSVIDTDSFPQSTTELTSGRTVPSSPKSIFLGMDEISCMKILHRQGSRPQDIPSSTLLSLLPQFPGQIVINPKTAPKAASETAFKRS